MAESDLKNRIAVLMGGRAAETLIFSGDVSSGAADDLQRATEIALEMVTRFGMDGQVGQRTYAPPAQPLLPGVQIDRLQAAELTAREIDVAVRDIVAEALKRAEAILQERRDDLEKGAALLLARETITADEFTPIQPCRPREETIMPPAKAEVPNPKTIAPRTDAAA
jgi:cell division protease FtsH